jgi:hypothetical protein
VRLDDIWTNIEALDLYLNNKLGETNMPLAYIVHDRVEVPEVNDGFGQPSYREKMVMRGDYNHAAYINDNIAVWNAICHTTHGGIAWSWVSQFDRSMDGQGVYQALKSHYLGTSYQARIKASADAVFTKMYFDGTRSFTFETYTSTLMRAFTDFKSTGEEVAEELKIQVLLRGIIAPSLQAAVHAVQANAELKSDHEKAVNYLAEANDNLKATASAKQNVSAAKATKPSPKKKTQDT